MTPSVARVAMLVSEQSNPSPTALRMSLPSDARLPLCDLSGHGQATRQRHPRGARKGRGKGGGGRSREGEGISYAGGGLGHKYSSGLGLTPPETFARHSAPPPRVQKDNTIHAANRWNSAFRGFYYFSVSVVKTVLEHNYRHRWAPTKMLHKN